VGGPKFIYIIRHPIDRLVSHYIHEWTQRVISIPIDDALDRHPELIDYSRYAMQLAPYKDAFSFDAILPVFFDQLTDHPQETLEHVCCFIGYPNQPRWDSSLDQQNISSDRLRRSPLRDAIVNMPGLSAIRRNLIPQSWRDRAKALWTMNERPSLSDSSLTRLRTIFDEDLARLGKWLGIDLTCENFHTVARSTTPVWAGQTAGSAA